MRRTKSGRSFRLALAVVAAASMASSVTPEARGDAPRAEDFEGRFRYMDGEEGRRQIDRAIGRAVDGLPFFVEPVAEDRVEARVGPFMELRFELQGDRLTFSADDWGPVTSRLGGPAVTVQGPAGSELSMTQRMRRGRLVQRLEHADGARTNTFALSGDGEVLWLSVEISSSQLPNDARYRLRYRRTSGHRRRAAR